MDKIRPDAPELSMLKLNKESGYNYRERRQSDWKENYTLYRDKVTINRLTQRQSVNLPLMKQTIRTLLKDVDDMPVLYFENLDNDKDAEIFQNEYWKWILDFNHMELKDIIDKRQVFLFGRSFDQMQIEYGKITITIQDPEDILVDRYMDPADLDSSRFLIHTHIFKPLSVIEQNPDYDKKAIADLKQWYATEQGLIKSQENKGMLTEKNQKMADMGLSDVNDPVLGETVVELSMHFVYHKEKNEDEQLYLYVECDDMRILMKKRLEEVIGSTPDHYWRNHFPYNTWADDLDRQDFWSDGIGDIVRTPNKVLNSWFSQLVENRTLRNFGMNYYDATKEGFSPQTFDPVPGGWYPLPGKPSDVYQKVDIPDLSESLDEMTFVITMLEKATGGTATQQGVQTANRTTLGEVQLALGEAKARIKGMSKFYTAAWKSRGEKFLKLIEAAPQKLDAVKIYKKGKNTNAMFSREIEPKDWVTKSGYATKVWSQDEKNSIDQSKLEKINMAVMNMPGNPKLMEIYQRKLLEMAELTPDEINEVMGQEEQKQQALMNTQQVTGPQGITGQPGQPPTPQAAPPPKPQQGLPINNLAKPPMMATAQR
jgi:hypothetical protein